jgi:hypothetical protein
VSRRILIRLAVGVAGLAALVCAAWLLMARQVEGQVVLWAEARRAEGYTVAWQHLDVSGFPLSFAVTLAEPRLAKDGWSAEAPRLVAHLLPWRPERIDLAAPRLAVTGPEASGALDDANALLLILDGRASRVTIEGAAATGRFRAEDLGRADRAKLVIDRFAPTSTDWNAESLAGRATLWGTQPAPRFASELLFAEPFDLDLEGSVKGPLKSLAGWRDAGGTADLTALRLSWGPMKLDGNATLALDGQMRPLGAGTAKLQGLAPVIDRLVAKRQIRAQEASIAKIVLGLMAQPTASGVSEVTVPITAQDGKLFLGPVAVATLKPLAD